MEKWLVHVGSAQLVIIKELIAYETWHDVMWLGGEDQGVRLGYEGWVASVKGKLEAQVRWIVEVVKLKRRAWCRWTECNGKKQARL